MTLLPPGVSDGLLDAVFPRISHPQPTIRGAVCRVAAQALQLRSMPNTIEVFRTVLHRLLPYQASASHDAQVEPFEADGLLKLLGVTTRRMPPALLLSHWEHMATVLDHYLAHPAAMVRQETSELVRTVASRDCGDPELPLLHRVLDILTDTSLHPDLVVLNSDTRPSSSSHHGVPAPGGPPVPPSAWQWWEGRLLAHELLIDALLGAHQRVLFPFSAPPKHDSNQISFPLAMHSTGFALKLTVILRHTLALTTAAQWELQRIARQVVPLAVEALLYVDASVLFDLLDKYFHQDSELHFPQFSALLYHTTWRVIVSQYCLDSVMDCAGRLYTWHSNVAMSLQEARQVAQTFRSRMSALSPHVMGLTMRSRDLTVRLELFKSLLLTAAYIPLGSAESLIQPIMQQLVRASQTDGLESTPTSLRAHVASEVAALLPDVVLEADLPEMVLLLRLAALLLSARPEVYIRNLLLETMGRVFDFIGTLIQKPDGLDVPTFSPFAFIDHEVATDSTLTENAHRTGSFDLLRQAIAFRRDLQGGRWPEDPEAGGASQAAGETFDANSCTGVSRLPSLHRGYRQSPDALAIYLPPGALSSALDDVVEHVGRLLGGRGLEASTLSRAVQILTKVLCVVGDWRYVPSILDHLGAVVTTCEQNVNYPEAASSWDDDSDDGANVGGMCRPSDGFTELLECIEMFASKSENVHSPTAGGVRKRLSILHYSSQFPTLTPSQQAVLDLLRSGVT